MEPEDDYKTGYGKPPKKHQFKKGARSGNVYGRKGKPENREAIRIRKEQTALAKKDPVLAFANKKRRVETGSGSKTMTTLEVILEMLGQLGMKGDKNVGFRLLKLLLEHQKGSVAPPAPEQERLTGVMVIPGTPNSQEDTMVMLRMEDQLMKLQDEVQALEQRRDLLSQESATAKASVHRASPLPSPVVDVREVRVYGGGVGYRPGQSTLRADPPIPGTSLKADGTYR